MPELSVIISNYNNVDKLKLALHCYKNQTFKDFEIIVASDGSSDGTLDYIKQNKTNFPYKIKCVWHKDLGYRLARIRNCAWRIAESNRVIFTDQDLVPNADCLANYAAYKDKEVAVAGYIGWIDKQVHSIFTEDSISKVTHFDPFMVEGELRDLKRYNAWVLWGGNMSLTKTIYNKTNGFDEEFQGWGGEDTDMGFRCDRMGCVIKTLPEAKMFHLNHAPSNSLNKTGTELFFSKKQHDKSIIRNVGSDYSDVVII